jgi:hypothetical protein
VTVKTNNGTATPRDRVLWIELRASDHYADHLKQVQWVGQMVELPQGELQVTTQVLLPQEYSWARLQVQTFEDGKLVQELTGEDHLFSQNHQWSEAFPSILILHEDAPKRDDRMQWVSDHVQRRKNQAAAGGDVDQGEEPGFPDLRVLFNEFEPWHPGMSVSNRFSGMDSAEEMVNQLNRCPRLDILSTTECPEHWLALSGVDLIFIPHDHLKQMRQSQAPKFAAIEQWVLAGGTLIVWNTQPVDDLSEKTWQLFARQTPLPDKPAVSRTARQIPLKDLRNQVSGYGYGYGYGHHTYANLPHEPVMVDRKGDLRFNTSALPAEELPDITAVEGTYTLGYGLLVVVPGSPFPGTPDSWERLANQIGSERWATFQRLGVSRTRKNEGFWDFLIPGVGMAPVTSFLVLISLFVIVIGPVNYFLLRAMKRLNWLVFTVPLGATVVTTALMTYAIFADGFSTRTRIRSVTLINQVESRGASWSLQAYYAGLAPSGGLQFPTDTAIHLREQYPTEDSSGTRILHWRDQQWLRQGYFRSRVTRQLLAIRPYQTDLRLQIEEDDQGGGRVTNLLETELRQAIVVNSQGTVLGVGPLAPGESQRIPAGQTGDPGQIRRLLADADMQRPPGFDQAGYNRVGYRHWHSGRLQSDWNLPEASITTSAMERELSRASTAVLSKNRPRSYLALVAHFPEVPWGVEGVNAGEQSIDVIHGQW